MKCRISSAACLCFFVLAPLLPGQSTEDRISKSRKLIEAREYKTAEAALREILSEEPANAEAGCLLGLSLLGQEKFKEAEAALLTAEKGLPPTAAPEKAAPEKDEEEAAPSTCLMADNIQIALARAYMGQNQLSNAEAALSRAEKIRRSNPDLYFYRGVLDAHRKDYAASAHDMDKTIEMDPKRAEAYYYAGIAYNQIKQPDKMVERFQSFLKLAPDAPEAAKVKALLRGIR
jgi:cytochrome c-type biogenesis protein CcmH/NrfG